MHGSKSHTRSVVRFGGSAVLFFFLTSTVAVAGQDGEATAAAALATESQTPPSSRDLSPYEMEARGLRIGTIAVLVDNIFDPDDSREDGVFYRFSNRLHVKTREETIANQLLFRSGDVFSTQKLAESERILRTRGYLNGATVVPGRVHDGLVDVVVRVHDVWTLNPNVTFGRAGGQNRSGFELEEKNLLGFGKSLSLSAKQDFDRTTDSIQYEDWNLLGSWWHLSATYANNSDGDARSLQIGLPFYSLDSRWSLTSDVRDESYEQALYDVGHETGRVSVARKFASLEGGISHGLQEGWTRRFLGGLRYEDMELTPLEGDALSAPEHRRLAYPWVGFEVIEDRFAETSNLQQIGRTEDLFLGRSLRAEVGWSPGSSEFDSALLYSLKGRWALTPGADDVVQFAASSFGRFESGTARGVSSDASISAFHRLTENQLLFGRIGFARLDNPDPETQLLLGGETGLRGYPLHFLGGTTQALGTLEYRFFTDWYPLRLVRVGGAAFFDMGRAWSTEQGVADPGWLRDLGVGLRLGNARSSRGTVIHVDVAVPLDRTIPGADPIDSVQVLVSTKTSF